MSAWDKSAWKKAIDDSEDQFEALASCMKLIYQQGFELAKIELQNEMTPIFVEGVNVMKHQQELLKKILKSQKEKYKEEMIEIDAKLAGLKEAVKQRE